MTGGPDSSFDPNKKAEKWLFFQPPNEYSWLFYDKLGFLGNSKDAAFRFTEAFHQILTISAFTVFSKNFARNYLLIFDSSTFACP